MSEENDRKSIIEAIEPRIKTIQNTFGQFLSSEVGNKTTIEKSATQAQAEATYEFVNILMQRAIIEAQIHDRTSIEYEDIAAIVHRDPDLAFLIPIIPKPN